MQIKVKLLKLIFVYFFLNYVVLKIKVKSFVAQFPCLNNLYNTYTVKAFNQGGSITVLQPNNDADDFNIYDSTDTKTEAQLRQSGECCHSSNA